MFTDVSKNVSVDDIPPEEAIRDLCTKNGVLHEIACAYFMQGLEALKTPYNPHDADIPEPTQPDPEARH